MDTPGYCHSLPTHSSTWSVIRSLSTLSPPPSYPSLDHLSSLCSSGYIPVFLHPGVKIPPSASFDDIKAHPLGHPDAVVSCLVSASASTTTLDSTGTFGPVRVTLRRPTVVESREEQGGGTENNPKRSSKPSGNKVKRPVSGPNLRRPLGDITRNNQVPQHRPSASPPRPKLVSPPSFDMSIHRASLHISSAHERALSNDRDIAPSNRRDTLPASFLAPTTLEDDIQSLLVMPSQSMSTLPSPTFAPPSVSSSLSPESSPGRAHPNKLKQAINKGMHFVTHSPEAGIGTSPTRHGPTAMDDIDPSKRSRFRRARNGSTSTTDSATSSGYYDAPPPPPLPSPGRSLPAAPPADEGRFASLPVTMAWLKDIVVELVIDQEGFRVARPTFRLAGYTGPPTGAMSLSLHHASAQADFMPRKREAFVFHHGTLDTAPILRRVTVNGDESRDYTSRQATLSLKSEGAYSVRGTESAHGHGHGGEAAEGLAWRFDYFVRDKLSPTGKPVPGEKTLTPLCFSCAPGLLLPTHAKKVRLVHVVKKSVVAKLVAEKVLPPAPPVVGSSSETGTVTGAGAGTVMGGFLKGHRRARSHAHNRSMDEKVETKTLSPSISYHPGSQAHRILQRDDIPPLPPLPLEVTRHIVAKDVLASLLADHSASETPGTGSGSGTRQRHSMLGDGSARPLNPLSPPSRRHARRASEAGAASVY